MKSEPRARLLDLTRLFRRAGRRMTGVDRVEFAYLKHLVADSVPLFALVRTRLGYMLLDQVGCDRVRDAVLDNSWGPNAEADLRRWCLTRTWPPGLSRMLRRHLPPGCTYLNTGHSNLSDRVIAAVNCLPDNRIAVLVHDTIPLDMPQYQRPETHAAFSAFIARVSRAADLVICNSAQTEADVIRHCKSSGRVPPSLVAHLGVPHPAPGIAPSGPWDSAPYFVTLGTIEPRKNHALLLDLWQQMKGEDAPHLLILGTRGWRNKAVFAQLDQGLPRVHEIANLEDDAVFALLKHSAGLLFPSFAEGYGLPPIEAAALGVPVVCNDLDIYHEVLENIPIYADVSDGYLWSQTIDRLTEMWRTGARTPDPIAPPDWDTHFNRILTSI
ncbi:glycosyltransferase family 1 protein [Puniceibacterium sp. IMCC21224]|uniref:glycosyltransferase family 4 protein n=1 Tax=Puniceibacterium sp. IMCC21224 TaxID=1618204 RepID=UPI00064DC60E|nr:glycosyltransferase family 1 protein [Puniceibacterium sp. IMCC21224]